MSEEQYGYLLHNIEALEKVIYGDSRLGAQRKGIAQSVLSLEQNVLTIQVQIGEMLPLVRNMSQQTEIAYQAAATHHRNRISDAFGRVTLTLAVVLAASPLSIPEVRHKLIGTAPYNYVIILAIFTAAFAILTAATRGGKE